MYIMPIGSQTYIYDRDEKRVGKYTDLERVPEPIKVSYDVRKTTLTKIQDDNTISGNNLKKDPYPDNRIKMNIKHILPDWLGKLVDIYV